MFGNNEYRTGDCEMTHVDGLWFGKAGLNEASGMRPDVGSLRNCSLTMRDPLLSVGISDLEFDGKEFA